MLKQRYNDERLSQLRELLDIQYEKLYEYEKAIELTDGQSQRIALRQQIKRNLVPRLRETEEEYASLLADSVSVEDIPEIEAQNLVFELIENSNRIDYLMSAGASKTMIQLLQEIKVKLNEPEKSAAAKLKVVLPIIPMVASYEFELDTEAFLTRSWRSIRSLFEKLPKSGHKRKLAP